MLWNIGKRCTSAGSPFLNCHAVDVRSHSDVVILAAWEGHLNNIHVGILITFPAPGVFLSHNAFDHSLSCLWYREI